LQLLTTLGLNPAQVQLISGFIDTYLELNTQEEALFQQQLATIEPKQEEVMEIVTSWMREGIERGLAQGRQREAVSFVLRQLKRRFGVLSSQLEERIQALSVETLEDLGEALLDFTDIADLETWLRKN
jgi:cysteinyl-tRNA synthetase